jgi:hypothetical protein
MPLPTSLPATNFTNDSKQSSLTDQLAEPRFRQSFIYHYMTVHDAVRAIQRAWLEVVGSDLDEERAVSYASVCTADPSYRSELAQARSSLSRSPSARLEDHLEQLARIRDAAFDSEKYSAAVSAEIARGKAQGFYQTGKEKEDPDAKDAKKLSDDELRREATEILAKRRLKAQVSITDVEGNLSGRPGEE